MESSAPEKTIIPAQVAGCVPCVPASPTLPCPYPCVPARAARCSPPAVCTPRWRSGLTGPSRSPGLPFGCTLDKPYMAQTQSRNMHRLTHPTYHPMPRPMPRQALHSSAARVRRSRPAACMPSWRGGRWVLPQNPVVPRGTPAPPGTCSRRARRLAHPRGMPLKSCLWCHCREPRGSTAAHKSGVTTRS